MNILKASWTLVQLALIVTSVTGHLSTSSPLDAAALSRRHDFARRCSGVVLDMKKKRHEIRKAKRSIQESDLKNATYVVHGVAPTYDFLKEDACVLTPEVSDGPYVYPESQLLRQSIVEDQIGVPLELNIGVMDINTCAPMRDVLVNIWHCNATGSYSSFTGLSPDEDLDVVYFAKTGKHLNGTHGLGDLSWLHTDSKTWLRGMWPTDDNGVTVFDTIVPGFYIDRAIHIHVQAYTDWVVRANGTVQTGNIVNTGQIFFNETLTEELMALEPYADHTKINRTTNLDDGIFSVESITGAMTILDTEPMDGVDNANGLIGYITFVVDSTTIADGSTANADPSVILTAAPLVVPSGIPPNHA